MTAQDLRDHVGEVLDRVQASEAVTITRGGTPVAELKPLPGTGLTREALVEHWRRLPVLDERRLREDLDLVSAILGPQPRHHWVPKSEFLAVLRALPRDSTLASEVADVGGTLSELSDPSQR